MRSQSSSTVRTVMWEVPDLRRVLVISILVMTQLLSCLPRTTDAFQTQVVPKHHTSTTMRMAVVNADDEIAKQLARAKALLEKSKAKIEAKQTQSLVRNDNDDDKKKTSTQSNNQNSPSKIPFFATQVAQPKSTSTTSSTSTNKRDKVVKATNEDGLVTIDGDLMAKLSETEEWEIRSLQDVFESETKNFKDPVAERDVAASIFGLQKVLKTEDFQRIFDKRNRFIGEQ